MLTHTYETRIAWVGSTAGGYRVYSRAHNGVPFPATQELALSADPAFRGSHELLNPEQLLVMAASSCQLLSFLAVAARTHVGAGARGVLHCELALHDDRARRDGGHTATGLIRVAAPEELMG